MSAGMSLSGLHWKDVSRPGLMMSPHSYHVKWSNSRVPSIWENHGNSCGIGTYYGTGDILQNTWRHFPRALLRWTRVSSVDSCQVAVRELLFLQMVLNSYMVQLKSIFFLVLAVFIFSRTANWFKVWSTTKAPYTRRTTDKPNTLIGNVPISTCEARWKTIICVESC